MANGRYSYNNLITASSMLTASSIWPGTVGSALKEGTGSGTMTPSGAYSGAADLLYTVEIDLAGEVGVATFKWRRNTSTGWEATGVLTSTADTVLENGVQVRFAGGTGTDFVLADRWTFKAVRFFAPGKIIDLDPDTPWRSANFSARPVLADVDVEIFLPAADNLALRSEEFDLSPWVLNISATMIADQDTAPDGLVTADKLTFSANQASRIEQDVSANTSAGTQYTFSVWVRTASGTKDARLTAWDNVTGAQFQAFTATTTWTRLEFTFATYGAGSATRQVAIWNASAADVGSIFIWGAQLEAAASAGIYLPTTSATASRAASFTDKTVAAFSASGSLTGAFWTGQTTGQYVYVGAVVPFDRITVDIATAAAGSGALVAEYYNGSAWVALSGVTDGTASGGDALAQDGDITWTLPTDWGKQGDAGLDAGKYYVRLAPTGEFVTTDPDAERLAPTFLPETLTIDLASAKTPTAVVLHGHNLSSGATAIQLLGNSSDEWGNPASTQNLTWAQDTIALFPTLSAYRYWQIRIADKANADGYAEIGEVFLGTYFEPSKNFVLDFDEGQEADEEDERTAAGTPRPILRNRARTWDLPYRVLGTSDRTSFTTLFEALKDRAAVKSKPFFFTPDPAVPAETHFVYWIGPLRFVRRSSAFSDLRVELEERPLSAF